MSLDKARARLARWHANEGENPGSFDNLYNVEDQPSLLICCSRSSNRKAETDLLAKRVLAERHFASKEVLLKNLMPELKPKIIVDLVGTGLKLSQTWCYLSLTAKAQMRKFKKREKDKDPNRSLFGYADICFTEAICKASDASCRTTYIMMYGSDGWSSSINKWTKLTVRFPQVRFILIFALMPRNMGFNRTGWIAIVDGQVWGFSNLAKILRVHCNEEVDKRYRLMVQEMVSDGTNRDIGMTSGSLAEMGSDKGDQ